jgi:uncharacterized protein (TIGR02594 family)
MISVPSDYQWLNTVGTLPRIVSEALKEYGTIEAAGAANCPKIMAWAEEVGIERIGYRYTADSVPWCGLFMAVVALRAGKEIPQGPLYALNWSKFGDSVAARGGLNLANKLVTHPGKAISLGDVLVFRREGGGHVGLCAGEDDDAFHVLGGNQSDRVCFTRIAKARLVAARRPKMTVPPASMKPYRLAKVGGLSRNEA